jgi:hypothetical protein
MAFRTGKSTERESVKGKMSRRLRSSPENGRRAQRWRMMSVVAGIGEELRRPEVKEVVLVLDSMGPDSILSTRVKRRTRRCQIHAQLGPVSSMAMTRSRKCGGGAR